MPKAAKTTTSLYRTRQSLVGSELDDSVGEEKMNTTFRGLFVSIAAIGVFTISQATYAQDKIIKIGALFPISGPGSYFGAQDKQGVELALEQLNKTGVNGYKFVVQYEDSS